MVAGSKGRRRGEEEEEDRSKLRLEGKLTLIVVVAVQCPPHHPTGASRSHTRKHTQKSEKEKRTHAATRKSYLTVRANDLSVFILRGKKRKGKERE